MQDAPALLAAIAADPVLSGAKLVAATGGNDALLPRGGVRGFPHWGVWLEWNKRWAADISAFLCENRCAGGWRAVAELQQVLFVEILAAVCDALPSAARVMPA